MPARIHYEFGQQLNKESRLTYIMDIGNRKKRRFGLFMCECGEWATCDIAFVKYGHVKSCGCLKMDVLLERSTKHGRCSHPLFSTWRDMIYRCTRETNCNYHKYGGRGIGVSEEWMDDETGFETFAKDMGEKPTSKHSIDRVDNSKGYSKENCVWATYTEQLHNRTLKVPSKTGVKGVTKIPSTGHYSCKINYEGKTYLFGTYHTKEQATKVRAVAEAIVETRQDVAHKLAELKTHEYQKRGK